MSSQVSTWLCKADLARASSVLGEAGETVPRAIIRLRSLPRGRWPRDPPSAPWTPSSPSPVPPGTLSPAQDPISAAAPTGCGASRGHHLPGPRSSATHLGEQAGPEGLHVDAGRLDEGVDLVLLQGNAAPRVNTHVPAASPGSPGALTHRDGHLVVVKNEGRVDAGELGDGGHGAAGRGASRRMK